MTAVAIKVVLCCVVFLYCTKVRSKQYVHARNDLLLEYVCEAQADNKKFFDALKDTDQQHIVNYIQFDGG